MNWFDIDTEKLLALVLTPLVSAIITRLFARKTPGTYDKERYEMVIFPVFDKLEPILYKKRLSNEDLKKVEECRKLVFDHRQIAGGRMLHCFSLPAETMFRMMSRIIDSEFDLCSWKLDISQRPLDYRLNRSRGVSLWLITLFTLRIVGIVALIVLLSIGVFLFLLRIL